MYQRLSDAEEAIGQKVISIALKVHRELGPGLLEKIYEACFCYELEKAGIPYQRQMLLPIRYDDRILDEALRLDVLIDSKVICEFKAREELNNLWQAQIISPLD